MSLDAGDDCVRIQAVCSEGVRPVLMLGLVAFVLTGKILVRDGSVHVEEGLIRWFVPLYFVVLGESGYLGAVDGLQFSCQ
ncbi:MAG: hypothetical protein ACT4NY_01915 [Pseudonocardiales bacterium]